MSAILDINAPRHIIFNIARDVFYVIYSMVKPHVHMTAYARVLGEDSFDLAWRRSEESEWLMLVIWTAQKENSLNSKSSSWGNIHSWIQRYTKSQAFVKRAGNHQAIRTRCVQKRVELKLPETPPALMIWAVFEVQMTEKASKRDPLFPTYSKWSNGKGQLLLFLVRLNMAASTISSTIMLCMRLQSRKELGKHLNFWPIFEKYTKVIKGRSEMPSA